ncbi:putative PE family protein PE23 [Mycobacterium simulans]|nr:putative PE family protein PE23 [Mycobacterium simulans]
MAAFHDQFVRNLQAGVSSYAGAEAVNVEQQLLNAVNAPSQLLTGAPADRRRRQRDGARPGRRRWRFALG